jgi:DNA-binding NtrC family response regulator
MAHKILLVEDDPAQARRIETIVSTFGYQVIIANQGKQALDFLYGHNKKTIHLILLDLIMPDISGMDILSEVHKKSPGLPVIVLTTNGSVAIVIESMRSGAYDFIVKPANPERLQVSIHNALQLGTLASEFSRLNRCTNGQMHFDDIITKSARMCQTVTLAKRAAKSNISVLIEGESGVGKEVLARAIQGESSRAGKPFVAVNCGAIPENLVESTLFGHEKGAFTGANDRHIGKFSEASTGTLFLDEVGELPLDMQVKLLRALQEGEIDPIGSRKPVTVDVRIISATNCNLQNMIAEGKFREDLYYRLNVFTLSLPPLRERRDDIPELVDYFIQKFSAEERKIVHSVMPDVLETLSQEQWPGNIRQLQNAIYRAVVLSDASILGKEDFPHIFRNEHDSLYQNAPTLQATCNMPSSCHTQVADSLHSKDSDFLDICDTSGHVRSLSDIEANVIKIALEKYNGRISDVARYLGVGRSTLYRKIRGIELSVSAAG